MTDKVQKIREEVARIQLYTQSEVLKQVLDYIDEVQKEPISEDLEKAANDWNEKASFNPFYMVMNGDKPIDVKQDITTHADSFKAGAKWQKQKDSIPVSEELEEAAKNYALNNTPWDDCKDEIQESFKAGAKWQREQDQSTIELAEDHAMLAGMEKMKEEMIAKAIDGYVIEDIEEGNGDFLLSADYLPKSIGLKDQQKVKVIVIKED